MKKLLRVLIALVLSLCVAVGLISVLHKTTNLHAEALNIKTIQTTLENSGRFQTESVEQEDGHFDMILSLDKENGQSVADVSFSDYGNESADIVSYTFSKESALANEKDIRWGFSLLMDAIGSELTDEIWQDIMEIATKNEQVNPLGNDYDGFSDDKKAFFMIYADLGDTVQIDIHSLSSNNDNSSHFQPNNATLPWNLIVVNPWNALPENAEPELLELSNGERIDSRIYPDLQQMFDDARADGLDPEVTSGYRSQKKQRELFDDKVQSYRDEGFSKRTSKTLARKWVSEPGYSEHETGLALDINAREGSSAAVYEWLAENSSRYGFILRYPKDKTEITGIDYEPWHFRYVGPEAAAYITEQNLTLEEYLEQSAKN